MAANMFLRCITLTGLKAGFTKQTSPFSNIFRYKMRVLYQRGANYLLVCERRDLTEGWSQSVEQPCDGEDSDTPGEMKSRYKTEPQRGQKN